MVPDIYEPVSIAQAAHKCDKCIDKYFVSEEELEEHKKIAHSKAAQKAEKEAIEDTKKVASEAKDFEEKEAAKETLEKVGVKV